MAGNIIKIIITGDAKGAVAAAGEATAATEGMGGAFGKLGILAAAGTAAVAAAAVGAGIAVFKVGESFESAYNAIRVQTGETGVVLDGLHESFRNVAKNTPASFDAVAAAIGGVHQKLDLTGKPLEDLSLQLVQLSRITKTDVATNVKGATDLFNNWGVATQDQAGTLDLLFRASQHSGVAVGALMDQMSGAGVQMRAAGFTIDQTAALLATLGKNGLDVSDVMPGLNKGLAAAAKQGKDASTFLRETFDSIKNAKTDTEASGKALDVFGAKAGPKLAGLIREGKLSWDEMLGSIQQGDTIKAAVDDVSTLGGKLGKLKNQAMVALEPLGMDLVNGVESAMDKIGPVISDGLNKAGKFASNAWDNIVGGFQNPEAAIGPKVDGMDAVFLRVGQTSSKVVSGAKAAWSDLSDVWGRLNERGGVMDTVMSKLGPVSEKAGRMVSSLVGALEEVWNTLVNIVEGFIDRVNFGAILDNLKNFVGNIMDALGGLFDFLSGIFNLIKDILTGNWGELWDDVKQVLGGAVDFILGIVRALFDELKAIWEIWKAVFSEAWDWLWSHVQQVVSAAWGAIVGVVQTAFGFVWGVINAYLQMLWFAWSNVWNALTTVVSAVFSAVVGTIQWLWGSAVNIVVSGLNWINAMWNGIWNGFTSVVSSIWDGIIGSIKGGINGAIGLINGFIDFVNRIQFHISIPDWVPVVGGHGFDFDGLHLGRIPYLAMGDLITKPTLAVVGEDGPELVLPLNKPSRRDELLDRAGLGPNSSGSDGGAKVLNLTQHITALDPQRAADIARQDASWYAKTSGF